MLDIRGLKTHFFTDEGTAPAVDGMDLTIKKGQTIGLVGESGCGKSVTALSVLRLIPDPPGKIVEGQILYDGQDLMRLSESEMRRIRGNQIAMIFQEPGTSLNPVFTIGDQIMEAITLHQDVSRGEARNRAIEMLKQVQIPLPEQRIDEYPHQMSGGMKQRAMIAMALSCNPSLLIADEPTTALDVTIQAQILQLIQELQAEKHMAVLLITHDLGIVAEMTEEIYVMYAGLVVEHATTEDLFGDPQHPYTTCLFESLPRTDIRQERLLAIPGTVPPLTDLPTGCHFRDRCPRATEECARVDPPLELKRPNHLAACINVPTWDGLETKVV